MNVCSCECEKEDRGGLRERQKEGVNAEGQKKHKWHIWRQRERKGDHWWVELISFEWDILHLSSQYVLSFRSNLFIYIIFFLSNEASVFSSLLLISVICLSLTILVTIKQFPYSISLPPPPPLKTREHNPILSYFRAYGIWKSPLNFITMENISVESPRKESVSLFTWDS